MDDDCLSLEDVERLASIQAEPESDAARHLIECEACRGSLRRARQDASLFGELQEVVAASSEEAGTSRSAELARDSIPGYRLLAGGLGGSQGEVYLARHLASNARVAVKVQHPTSASDSTLGDRFEREIEVARSMHHPNIVPVLESGHVGARRWFAMPFIEGLRLDAWVADQQPPQRLRLELFVRVCRAIAHAHRCGVIHRDIKPSNILVDDDDVPHVLDFGIARLDGSNRVTVTGVIAGTPAYASPEQLVSDPVEPLTTSTDIYSLGVLLHEILIGEMPYPVAGGLLTVAARVQKAEPKLLLGEHRTVALPLRAIVGRCLEKAPDDRYRSVEDLIDDLERFLLGASHIVRARPWWYLVRRRIRCNARLLAGIGVAFAATMLAAGSVMYYGLRAQSQREATEQIQGVLRDILGAAGPSRMGGGTTLLEVLESTADRVDEALLDSRDVQAGVQFTIGETYADLMMYADAERHLSAALQRYRELAEDPPIMLARTLQLLGVAASHRRDRNALAYLREARGLLIQQFDTEALEVLSVDRDIAQAFISYPDPSFDRSQAGVDLQRILATLHRTKGPKHVEVARTLAVLADWHRAQRDPQQAEECFRRALAIFEGPENDATPWSFACLSEFASFLIQADHEARYREADELLVKARKMATHLFGDALTTRMLRQRSVYHLARRQARVAEQFSRDAVVHELRFFATRKPQHRAALLDLGTKLAANYGDPVGHQALLDSFRLFREYRGRGAYELASWLNGLALLERELGRPRRAEDLLSESLEFDCRVFGKDCPNRARALMTLGFSLCDRQEHRMAVPYLEEAQDIIKRTRPSRVEQLAAIDSRIAECHLALDEVKKR